MSLLLLFAGAGTAAPAEPGQPVLTMRIDWDNNGDFIGPLDTVSPLVDDQNVITIERGRSADFSGEAKGAMTFVLENNDDAYTPDRNWHDNPSFEVSTAGWDPTAIASLIAAGTSISQVTDHATGTGTKAGSAVLTATVNSGVAFPIPYRFLNGITYAFTVWLKSISGNLNVRAGLASAGTPSDIGSTSANITTSWVAYSGTFTPTADRTDVVFFVRTTTAAAATLRIDAIGVNIGATTNPYIEAPTKGQLVSGRPVHAYASWSGTDYPKFYGFTQLFEYDTDNRSVKITCYDVLKKLESTNAVAGGVGVAVSARDLRLAILESYERGNLNLIANPSFETDTSGWIVTGGAITRLTTDAVPGAGTACGQFAASGGSQSAEYTSRLVSTFYGGETYRFSVYLRCASGTQTWNIGLLASATGQTSTKPITVTTTWTRYTISMTLTAGTSGNGGLIGYINSTGANTVRLDAASLTRGQALYPYADVGTGRWANLMLNGSFDGNDTKGWTNGWANLITNPSFETNTTGWTTATDGFLVTGGTLTRVTAQHKFGAAAGKLVVAVGQGADFAITGTFATGVPVYASIWLMDNSGTDNITFGIGSNGTPADKIEATTAIGSGGFTQVSLVWTPSGNRSDARLYVKVAGGVTFFFDGAFVARMDTNLAIVYPYADTGPAGGGVAPTSIATSSAAAKYGSRSLAIVTPATTGAGAVYDLAWANSYFQAGETYTISLWLNCAAGTFPYKVALSANAGDGTFDEQTATGTVTAGTWTQVTFQWTPSADYSTTNAGSVWIVVQQTNGTARTIYVDGVRLIPGASADNFEMDQWDVAASAEADIYLAAASASGAALSALSALNALTLSRHWIRPTMASPWYDYVIEDRVAFAAKVIAETYTENIEAITGLEIDSDSVANIVPIAWSGGGDAYSDEDSIGQYGLAPTAPISGALFYPDRTVPDSVGPALIARYKDGVLRPTITLHNEFPGQVARDLNDLLDLTVDRFLIRHLMLVILTEELTISDSGLTWLTKFTCEGYPL